MAEKKAVARPSRPLRLEWLSPNQLEENPENWRLHNDDQMATLSGSIAEVGWAGALLYNERTKRLIDGHGRKGVPPELLVDGQFVPVLVGSWTEAQERLILATLDPIGGAAGQDSVALGGLLSRTAAEDANLRDFLASMEDRLDVDDGPLLGRERPGEGTESEGMVLRPHEHYDYVIVLARTTQEWNRLSELLELGETIGKRGPIGTGRGVPAARLIELLESDGNV